MPAYTTSYKQIAATGKTVLLVHFLSKDRMNELLEPISNTYEGALAQAREGHNFPSTFLPMEHVLYKHIETNPTCVYVIATHNPKSIPHELLHARFYADAGYRIRMTEEWNGLPEKTRAHITQFLMRLGYRESVIIDEYQAYRYTEKPNFFGISMEKLD